MYNPSVPELGLHAADGDEALDGVAEGLVPLAELHPELLGVYSAEGGCSGRGVQWMGVVLYDKNNLSYDVNHCTLFPLHPPLMNIDCGRVAALAHAGCVCEKETVDLRNFIVFVWAETLAH